MNKIYITILLALLILPLAVASQETLGTFKQGECVRLLQTSPDATYVNISSIVSPTSVILLENVAMQKTGTEFNYTFCNTTELGTYVVNGFGDDGGDVEIFVYDFDITREGVANENGVYIAIWLSAFILLYFGLIFKKKIPLVKLTGYTLIFLNGLLGAYVFDNPLTFIIAGGGIIFFFKGLMSFSKEIFD